MQLEPQERLKKLKADTPRHWGSLTPAGMVAHLTKSLEISLGRIDVQANPHFFLRYIVLPMTIWTGFIPQNRIKSPAQFFDEGKTDLEKACVEFGHAWDRFLEAAAQNPERQTMHPAFGPLTLRKWKKLHAVHFEHHLKQYGL
ncbi:DUF1569 domain-containing protein [Planctomycetota bacterium]